MDSVNSLITTLEMAVAVIPVCSPNSWPLRGALLTLRAATQGQSKSAVDPLTLKRAAHNLNRARFPAAEGENKVLGVARMAMSDALHRLIRSAPHGHGLAATRVRATHLHLVETTRAAAPVQATPEAGWKLYEPPELTPSADDMAGQTVHA